MPALHELIETGSYNSIRKLLVGGENPNSQDGEGRTPLHIAVMKCEINPDVLNEILPVVRELINHGADVNLGDNLGCTPLHLAVMCREYAIIEMLLQANAEINKKDNGGWAALHYATNGSTFRRLDGTFFYDPELRVVQLLLTYHPDLDIRNQNDKTPLMLAVRDTIPNLTLHIVHELLRKKASVNLQDSVGNSAMHYALDQNEIDVDVVYELARYGGSLRTTNNSGKTPQNSYLERLYLYHPMSALEKANYMIKLFLLGGDAITELEEDRIEEISEENIKGNLYHFLNICVYEVTKMYRTRLAPDYKVSDIVSRGAFGRDSENDNPIPLEVFDKVLEKLMAGRYKVYSDLIAAGISRSGMREKFAEKCCNIVETAISILKYDEFYKISLYLSNFDILNMLIACSPSRIRPSCFTSCKHFPMCSMA